MRCSTSNPIPSLVFAIGTLAFAALPAHASLLPEGSPPSGMAGRLASLAPAFRDFVARGSRADLLRLQRHVWILERPFASEKPDGAGEAVAAFLRGDWDAAEALWNGHPPASSARAMLFRAYLRFARGDYAGAERLFEALKGQSKAEPEVEGAAVYGLALSALRKSGDERSVLQLVAAEGEKALRKGTLRTAEEKLDVAWALYFLGDASRARRICKKLYPSMERDPRLFYLYGKILQALKRNEEARKAFARSIDLGAGHPEASVAYASVCMLLGDTGAAAEEAVAAETVYTGTDGVSTGADAWYLRRPEDVVEGAGRLGSEDLKGAGASFENCTGAWSSYGQEGAGDVAVMRGLTSKARRAYARAVAEDPLNVTARIKGACANLLSGKVDAAFTSWIEGVDLTAVPWAERALARLQTEHEKLVRAMSDCFACYLYEAQARLKRNFDDEAAHKTSAAVFHSLHFYDRALRAARVLRRKAPADLEGKERWAFALWHEALYARRSLTAPRLKELAEILDAVLVEKPGPAADYVLAMTRKAMGEKDLARAGLKRALARKVEAPSVLFPLARAARDEGRYDEAKELYERLFRREFDSRSSVMAQPAYRSVLRMIAARSGKGGSK